MRESTTAARLDTLGTGCTALGKRNHPCVPAAAALVNILPSPHFAHFTCPAFAFAWPSILRRGAGDAADDDGDGDGEGARGW